MKILTYDFRVFTKSLKNTTEKGVLMTDKVLLRLFIEKMTKKYLSSGKKINKVPTSKTQESYVNNTHNSCSGRIGWFEIG
jgi:hypothetical protein